MMKVLVLTGLMVAYFAPPFEQEVWVYGEEPYVMLVSKPHSLSVTEAWSPLLTHPRHTNASGLTALSYPPTSANGILHTFRGMCQQRSLGIEISSTLLTSQCTTDVTRYRFFQDRSPV